MELLKVPRVNLPELQSFTKSALIIVQGLPEVEPETIKVTTAYDAFSESMIKIKPSNYKKELDKIRDSFISGLVANSKAELKFPHEDEELKAALKQFTDIVISYGNELANKSYDQESAETDNLLNELKRVNLTVLTSTGLPRWIPVIENANNAFKTHTDGLIEETVTAEAIKTATKVSLPLIDELNNLFMMVFSQANSTKSEALFTAYKEIEVLIDSYK